MSSNHKPVLSGFFVIFVLSCLGLIIYSNTLDSSFHFDDENSIVNNLNIRHFNDLKAIWRFWPTRFVTYFTLAFNYSLEKLNVFGYHLFNLAVHLISAIIVWRLALLVFSTPVMKEAGISFQANPVAFFASLIFLTHPIQTQAVTYIIQRATSLSGMFYLLSLWLYAKARSIQLKIQAANSQRFYYACSLITAAIAMFTKETSITLPCMIILYETYFLRNGKRIHWKTIIPFLAILPIIPLIMFLTKSVNFQEMHRIIEPAPALSPWHHLLTQFRVIVTYLRLLFLPINQNVDYDYHFAHSLLQLPILASFLFILLVIIIALRIKSRYPLISFCIIWFFITIIPESSIIPIQDVIFEHRLYLSLFGYSIFLVCAVYYLFEKKNPKVVIPLFLFIIATYSILTYSRNMIWKNELTLWNDIVRKSPQKARPYNNRGRALQNQGKTSQALADFDQAIEINPRFAEAYINRGFIYLERGNLEKALLNFNKAIEIYPLAEAYNNRGLVYRARGELDEAISDFNKAIEIYPLAEAYVNRGLLHQARGSLDNALLDFNMAIEINPYFAEAYNNRGIIYANSGNLDKAISDFNNAIKAYPDFVVAYSNRARAYYSKKEYDKSWEDIHKIESLGGKADPHFLEDLKKASGRE